jgi:putative DNA-invertase from lambdoid prophage Rac
MSKAYGYIRVSTEKQDYDNQKFGILEYANKNNIHDVEFIEETISSRKKLEEREIWNLVNEKLNENDILITSELSRFGRSTLEVMHLFKLLTENKIKAHVIKNNIKLNEEENKITNQVLIFAFGLAAEIERDLISSRTKEALALRKAQGMKLGRQKGQQVKSKLDEHKDEIIDLLKKGVNVSSISKIFECGRTTANHYIRSRKLKEKAELLNKVEKV